MVPAITYERAPPMLLTPELVRPVVHNKFACLSDQLCCGRDCKILVFWQESPSN